MACPLHHVLSLIFGLELHFPVAPQPCMFLPLHKGSSLSTLFPAHFVFSALWLQPSKGAVRFFFTIVLTYASLNISDSEPFSGTPLSRVCWWNVYSCLLSIFKIVLLLLF